MVHSGSVPLYWRIKKSKYRLIGGLCSKCRKKEFPFREFCSCGATMEEVSLPEGGVVLTFTTIHAAPSGFEPPYNVAIIELKDKTRVCAQVVDKNIKVGDNVKAVFRKIFEKDKNHPVNYGLKFEKMGG